jgi:hypothetical protein
MKHWIAFFSLLTFNTVAFADELELSISDESIDGAYEIFYGNNFSTQISLMYTDVDNVENADVKDGNTYFLEEDGVQTHMAGFGVYANNNIGNLKTRLGGKVFYLDSEFGNEIYGIALGGALDAYVRKDIFFTGQILYAPDIITGGDFNNYWEINTRANFQVMNNARIYAGYRLIAADFEKEDTYRNKFTNAILPIGGDSETRDFFNGIYIGFSFSL